MRETELMQRIRGTVNHRDSTVRLWRNNTGKLADANGRWVEFGLAKGSADLVGIERRLVTPEMVGQTVGVFTAIEVKTAVGRLSPEQKAWLSVIRSFGGEAHVMRSVEEAVKYLKERGLAA